jgi:hypothetical protein
LKKSLFAGDSVKDSPHKTSELIVCIAERSGDDPRFGRVKLAELLFRCDFGAYAEFGESLTGARYRRQPNGPLADEFAQALLGLGESGALSVTPERIVVHRAAALGWLTAGQSAMVDEVVLLHRDDDATVLRALSDAFPGYALAEDGEEIPYHTVFISREAPTQADLDWGQAVARDLQEA